MPLVYACEQLSVKVGEALMVGDSRNDMLAAKSAMMDVVGVTYGYNYGEDISMYKPDAIVSDFADIIKLLKK